MASENSEDATTQRLSRNLSEYMKLTCNEPVTGLYYVHEHIRKKALYDNIKSKRTLLMQITSIKSELKKKLNPVNIDVDVDVSESLDKFWRRTAELNDKISALGERLHIVTEIEKQIQHQNSPNLRNKHSGKSLTSEKSSSSLRKVKTRSSTSSSFTLNSNNSKYPIGMGQLLDEMLMSGAISTDEYALKISQLAE
uniref:Uncharacterized protein n=1 Tax=Aplanochytrium stocchinoi TaxID=215587 RepID=A0A7S3PLT5_9STRA|mmetsp:Transcript_14761/g.18252  ORF Transcript_14761/g.18252 Transcript_14761/m.18252 type:complete len:196 (+) Transcript_14761:326-913(+)